MRAVALAIIASLAAAAQLSAGGETSAFIFPRIAKYGGIVALSDAAEQPQAGAKVVFDITAASGPEEISKGLESVARYLNLHAQAGRAPTEVKLALVLHGQATKVALQDDAYARVSGAKTNPNRELLGKLKGAGVEVYVCGQSLARNKYPVADVAPEVTLAVSAMTVNVNKQLDGYAYLAIH
ncbi:MAG TPA: DsrE family protein [Pirellulaceae bacterium]|nr:DsrE family protein [Pirellulaceae bacterium]